MYNLRRPPPSVIWKSRWPPLTVRHAISQPWPHGKIGDCEQSISFSIPWARLRVSLIVAYGIAAGRVEFEAALEEVLEDRSLYRLVIRSVFLSFLRPHFLLPIKMAAEDTTCDLAMWHDHVISWVLASYFTALESSAIYYQQITSKAYHQYRGRIKKKRPTKRAHYTTIQKLLLQILIPRYSIGDYFCRRQRN